MSMNYKIVLITAMSKTEKIIGTEKGLPWVIPEEYDHFLKCVGGDPVVMGRSTYDILKALKVKNESYEKAPETKLFVVTRDPKLFEKNNPGVENVKVCETLKEAYEEARKVSSRIIGGGGATAYGYSIPHAKEMMVSEIDDDRVQDLHGHKVTKFPVEKINWEEWRLIEEPEVYNGWRYSHFERIGEPIDISLMTV